MEIPLILATPTILSHVEFKEYHVYLGGSMPSPIQGNCAPHNLLELPRYPEHLTAQGILKGVGDTLQQFDAQVPTSVFLFLKNLHKDCQDVMWQL